MASPKAPGPPLPPIVDPANVHEVYADDVVIQVVNGIAHILFFAVQPSNIDSAGTVTCHRAATARVAMPMVSASALADCIKRIETAMQMNEKPDKLN